ncbi:hypothetical protein ASG90_05315 [Nocardioides sp. Soil797]|nr:hypothetical protein ASG90_05315 [Nocardioides sp. Soil797]
MPRLIDAASRADTLTLAINHVIATEGAAALSVRRISRASRVSAPTILHHFGSRARLLSMAAARTAADRLDDFAARQPHEGLRAMLPRPSERSWCTDPAVHARVWLGWLELWRTDPELERCFDDHFERLRGYVSVLTEGRLTPMTVETLLALAEGLQARIAAPIKPLSPTDADDLFLTMLGTLQVPVSPVAPDAPVPAHLRAAMNWLQHAGRTPAWRPDPEMAEAFRFDLCP